MADVRVPMSRERVMRLAHSVHEEMERRVRAESTSAASSGLSFVDSEFRISPVEDGVEMDYAVPVEYVGGTETWRYEVVRVTVRSTPFV